MVLMTRLDEKVLYFPTSSGERDWVGYDPVWVSLCPSVQWSSCRPASLLWRPGEPLLCLRLVGTEGEGMAVRVARRVFCPL